MHDLVDIDKKRLAQWITRINQRIYKWSGITVYQWNIKPFCFLWIVFKRTITTTTKTTEKREKTIDLAAMLIHRKFKYFFYSVLKNFRLWGTGPGFVGRIATNMYNIQTRDPLTSQLWGSLRQLYYNYYVIYNIIYMYYRGIVSHTV